MNKQQQRFEENGLILTAHANREENGWSLILVDEEGNGTAWEDTFNSAEEAFDEAQAAIAEQGMAFFIGEPDLDELLQQAQQNHVST